jgi:hypothetical protein
MYSTLFLLSSIHMLPTLGQDCQSYVIHDFLEQLKTAPEEVYPAALRDVMLIERRKE